MTYFHTIGHQRYVFADLRTLLAKATPARSGDQLSGVMAQTMQERLAAQMALAALPLKVFLSECVVPYEEDEVTRLILDTHNSAAFAPVAHLTVGDFRNWLLGDVANTATLAALAPGLTPEMVAALIHRAIGDQLTCVFVDHGLLRLNEGDMVMEMFVGKLHAKVIRVDASELFLGKLAGLSEPEAKRKIPPAHNAFLIGAKPGPLLWHPWAN